MRGNWFYVKCLGKMLFFALSLATLLIFCVYVGIEHEP